MGSSDNQMLRNPVRNSQILLCFAIGSAFMLLTDAQRSNGESESNVDSESLPCYYKGAILQHEESLQLDACTSCSCDNGSVYCAFESCPPIFCDNPVSFESECCDKCNSSVPSTTESHEELEDSLATCDPDKYQCADGNCIWVSWVCDGTADCLNGEDELGCPNDKNSCYFRGAEILHREIFAFDNCTTGACKNGTVIYYRNGCPSTLCPEPIRMEGDEPVRMEGECCSKCSQSVYVPVWKVGRPSPPDVISEGQVNRLVFDLTVFVNEEGGSVTGEGLWKLGAWASTNKNGKGKRTDYTKQILSQKQAATAMIRPPIHGSYEFNIPGVEYFLNATKAACSDMKYLCVEFSKGNHPSLPGTSHSDDISFTVEGVRNENNSSLTPKSLRRCRQFPACKATCDSDQYACADGSGCIWSEWFCDGDFDCLNGEDEIGCYTTCDPGKYMCADGSNCISVEWFCDGFGDCLNGEDEFGCPKQL